MTKYLILLSLTYTIGINSMSPETTQETLIGLLPIELQSELFKFNIGNALHQIQTAATIDEAIKRSKDLPMTNLAVASTIIEAIFRKFPATQIGELGPRRREALMFASTKRGDIAKKLGAQVWLDEQAIKAPNEDQLIKAIRSGSNVETIKNLIEKQHVNSNVPFSTVGESALNEVIDSTSYSLEQKLELLRYLLEHKADPNQPYGQSTLPLIHAIKKLPEAVPLLLEYKANPSLQLYLSGQTALDVAQYLGKTEIVNLLKETLQKTSAKA